MNLLRFRRLNLSGGAVWCLVALSARLDAGADVSVAALAADLDASDHGIVRRWLRELEAAGAILRQKASGRTSGITLAGGPPMSASGPPQSGPPMSAGGQRMSGQRMSASGHPSPGPSARARLISESSPPFRGEKTIRRGDGPDRLSPDNGGPSHVRDRVGSDGRLHSWPFGGTEWPDVDAPITDWDYYVGVNIYPRRYTLDDAGFPTGRRVSREALELR